MVFVVLPATTLVNDNSDGKPLHLPLYFGIRVRLVDVINCAKFYRNRLMGLVGFCAVSYTHLTLPTIYSV